MRFIPKNGTDNNCGQTFRVNKKFEQLFLPKFNNLQALSCKIKNLLKIKRKSTQI
jgi:hypothetical protein